MKRYMLVLSGIGIVALSGYLWTSGGTLATQARSGTSNAVASASDDGQATTSEANAGVLALRQELAFLKAEIAELRKQPAAVAAASAVPFKADSAVGNTPPLDPTEMERQKEEWHGHIAEVEAAFHGEARDARWAADTKSAVDQAFRAEPSIATKLRNVDCRSRTCRLELADDAADPVADKLVPVLVQLASSLPKVKSDEIVEANGSKTMVLFMSRRPEG